jgi:hypothetical protein
MCHHFREIAKNHGVLLSRASEILAHKKQLKISGENQVLAFWLSKRGVGNNRVQWTKVATAIS